MSTATYVYRVNRCAEVAGNNGAGWAVINLVNGLQTGPLWPTYQDAQAAASFLDTYYTAIQRSN